MKHVLMVCLGNICRSPLAEVILQHKATSAGLDWKVESAGTGAHHHIGIPADPLSRIVAQEHQLDLSKHHAKQLHRSDLLTSDLIYVMDKQNLRDVLALCQGDPALQSKVNLILSELKPSPKDEVPDPYKQEKPAFEAVFAMLEEACFAIVARYRPQTT